MPRHKRRWEQTYEVIQSVSYISIGVLGIIFSVVSLLGWDILGISTRELSDQVRTLIYIVLSAISLLLLAIGLERLTWLEKINNNLKEISEQIDQLSNVAEKSIGYKYHSNANEAYATAGRLITQARQYIRVVNTINTGPKAPLPLIEGIARTLKVKKDMGAPVKYEVVIALNSNNTPKDFEKEIVERMKIYKDNDVLEYYSLYILETSPSHIFDVIIIDNQHLGIALTHRERENNLNGAISFENQPEVATQFATWFDRVIIPSAIPFEKWISSRNIDA